MKSHFESRQFNALIDHATVAADAIWFAFKIRSQDRSWSRLANNAGYYWFC